ncbi:hypothetical protein [Clostridium sp.]|uniref:hypothetical protein n=1 Tax=Clostridium sp. TaxID=1506 RepID=UPI003F2AEFB7
MKTYKQRKADGRIVVTRFDKNRSYTEEYANIHEYNKRLSDDGMSVLKVLIAPIYYPVKFVFWVLYILIKGIYWDLPRFIYGKIKK